MDMNVNTRQSQDTTPRMPITPSQPAGGYLLDEQGREIAITEHMIQQACKALEQQWVPAPGNRR